jgi:hypothetical protein
MYTNNKDDSRDGMVLVVFHEQAASKGLIVSTQLVHIDLLQEVRGQRVVSQ